MGNLLLFWSCFLTSALQLGGVVGGVTFRSITQEEGGLRTMPGEGGGLVLHELKLEAAESTLGIVLGVLGH